MQIEVLVFSSGFNFANVIFWRFITKWTNVSRPAKLKIISLNRAEGMLKYGFWRISFCFFSFKVWGVSVPTALLNYTVSHIIMHPVGNQIYLVTLRPTRLTQASFLQKNQMLQNGFLIFLMLRWHSGIENHEIWTFKVNFLCQKTSESF